MTKIPTAEEFYKETTGCVINHVDVKTAMIEFAKLHVEVALEYASGKVQLSPELYDFISDSWESGEWFDKNSILNAYPLDKIK